MHDKKYVTDTSVVIEKAVSRLITKKEISGTILIPRAVLAELEHQANQGRDIGMLGLEELQELQKLKSEGLIDLEFIGNRPVLYQIENAKSGGEIDALIRDLAYENDAILITADRIQAESAKAIGLQIKYITPTSSGKIKLESFFDETTMSVHIKADVLPMGKKGAPGEWKLTPVAQKPLSSKEVESLAKEVIEKSRGDSNAFIEIARQGSTIVQFHEYRIVIVKPPVADGWEITAVRPIKHLSLADYNLPEKITERLRKEARGVLLAGTTGSGKSTLAQAIAEEYIKQGFITKTVESPRDLVLPPEATQYSKNFTSSEEIHDILFLVRPDYLIFDEVRDTPDFKLYTDLRLGGSNCIGVLHAATAIDAVQRFIGRLDTGIIPSVLDTVIFVAKGKVEKILTIRMTVKVPAGMTEADLARPVIEVVDFLTNKAEFEIYSYGEETVVIPVNAVVQGNVSPARNLAAKQVESMMSRFTDRVRVELISDNKAVVYVPEHDIARVIGKQGQTINEIEKALGISIDVKELTGNPSSQGESDGQIVNFDIKFHGKNIVIFARPNETYDVIVNGQFLLTATSGKKGEVKINGSSKMGRTLANAIDTKKNIELRLS